MDSQILILYFIIQYYFIDFIAEMVPALANGELFQLASVSL